MPIGLDHIVHMVADLDAGEAFYRRAGFIVSNRNKHPWGTHNHIIQSDGVYIELLGIGEPEKIPAERPGSFSFGAYNRDFAEKGEGLSMLLMNSRDAKADMQAFHTAGISNYEVFDFAREGKRADGTTVKLAFSLAYASDPNSPACGFAVCQHHFPENFWNASLQQHDNGARKITGVVFVADHPDEHRAFLSAYAGAEAKPHASGFALATPRGDLDVMTPHAFRERFGLMPAIHGPGLSLAAIRFAAQNLDRTSDTLARSDIEAHRHEGRIVVPPQAAHGAALIFEPL